MKRSELLFTLLLIPIDLIAITLGFIIAYYIRKHIDPFGIIYIPSIKEYVIFVSYFLPLWVLVFASIGLYNIKNTRSGTLEFSKILIAVPTALMLFVTVMFFIKESFFSRLIILYSLVLIIILVTFFRLFILFIQRFLFRFGIGVKRVLIIGTNELSKKIIDDLEKHPQKGFIVLGVIKTNQKTDNISPDKIIGELSNIGSLVAKINPDEIFQTDPNISNEENLNIIHLCEDKHIIFRFIPSLFALYSKNNSAETFAQIPVFEIRRSRLEGWGRIIKRIIDIIGSLLAIIIFLLIGIIVALLIKLTSPGPVFFIQERVGRDKNFKLIKFRTMYRDAEKRHEEFIKKYGNMFKLKDDPRVTKIGKILRKTSLDEIPQFINVLLGHMSLVGPRPPMPIEVNRYTREQKKRIGSVKPGITGLWQVSGRSDLSFDDWVKLDVYYIENWSLILDFWIILKTIWVLIKRKGAY